MLDVESKTNVSESVILFCDLEEVIYPMFYRDRRKKSLVFHRLFFLGRTEAQPTDYSLSVDCTPSNLLTNFKAFLLL